MDTLPERLQSLTHKKYFAYIAVIFFAFVTAFVFALLARQTTSPNVDQLRSEIRSGSGNNSGGGFDSNDGTTSPRTSTTNKPQSVLDRIISAVTGRKPAQQPSESGSNPGSGTAPVGGGTINQPINSGSVIPTPSSEEIIKKIEEEVIPMPKVEVGEYVLNTPLPSAPTSLKIYRLKTTYSEADIERMARTLGFRPFNEEKIVIERNKSGLVQVFDITNKLYLAVDNNDGTLLFTAEQGIAAPLPQNDERQNAIALARSLGFTQPCLSVTSTYSRKSQPGAVNVEIRCEWETTGAPIVNYFGILNLPVDKPLTSVTLGEATSVTDNDIVDQGGLKAVRPDDFNTIVVQRNTKTGNITAFSSNIQQVLAEIPVNSNQIIQPEQGFDNLKNNQKQFAFAAPQGVGAVDLRNVYVDGRAQANSVNINDFVIAYPTIPGVKQEYLCPEWITRSQGRLSSGYDGLFIESMRAVSDSRCGRTAVLGATVAAASTLPKALPTVIEAKYRGDTLQYKNFTFEGTSTDCPVKDQFTNAILIKPNVYLAFIDRNSIGTKLNSKGFKAREWWIAVTSEQEVTAALGNGGTLPSHLIGQYNEFRRIQGIKTTVGDRSDNPISGVQGTILACKILTTGSPSLYISTDRTRNVRVELNPVGGVSFAQPAFNIDAAGWDFTAQANGKLDFGQGFVSDRAYWEYKKAALVGAMKEMPFEEKGYVVKKSELISLFEATIAQTIGLTASQTRDLVGEVKREFNALGNTEYVKIVVAPRAFVDTYLPVTISPQPEKFYRYFFIVSPAKAGDRLSQPTFEKITPHAFSAVETGTLIITP